MILESGFQKEINRINVCVAHTGYLHHQSYIFHLSNVLCWVKNVERKHLSKMYRMQSDVVIHLLLKR